MEMFFLTGILLTVCTALGALIGYNMRRKESASLKKELATLRSKYRQAHGFHEWFGIYDLESFDGGQMWYAMMTTSEGRRLIRGEAEQVYPGLMAEHGIFEYEDVLRPKQQKVNSPASTPSASGRNASRSKGRSGSSLDDLSEHERASLREHMGKQSYCRSMPVLQPSPKCADDLN